MIIKKTNIVREWTDFSRTYVGIINELDTHLQSKYKLSLSEFSVLWLLSEQPEQRMRIQYIAESVNLSQSAISRLVSRLENNFVKRHICLDDQRGVYIKLTTLGEEKVNEMTSSYQDHLIQLLTKSNISQDMTKLLSTLTVLIK
ncbi:MarR family transcriptional regulator [Bacillus tropicus]|nr:MarR family transcriptional regulator [Bacillus tropicus]